MISFVMIESNGEPLDFGTVEFGQNVGVWKTERLKINNGVPDPKGKKWSGHEKPSKLTLNREKRRPIVETVHGLRSSSARSHTPLDTFTPYLTAASRLDTRIRAVLATAFTGMSVVFVRSRRSERGDCRICYFTFYQLLLVNKRFLYESFFLNFLRCWKRRKQSVERSDRKTVSRRLFGYQMFKNLLKN